MPIIRPVHQLYRYYDNKRRLLYIGASLNAVARMTGHKTTVPWYGRISKVIVKSFRTMKAALDAEESAIKKERPLFNKSKNGKMTSSFSHPGEMDVETVIHFFGGVGATARALGLKQPSVSIWRMRGKIPLLRQYQIREVTKGKLKADGK